jgi:hypothetical protein
VDLQLVKHATRGKIATNREIALQRALDMGVILGLLNGFQHILLTLKTGSNTTPP